MRERIIKAMSDFYRGEIRDGDVMAVLAAVEATRVSGTLHFDGLTSGKLALVRGQVAAEQENRPDGLDPVELFLAEEMAVVRVLQELPMLPVTRGDASRREGSLEIHVPADVMNYCERAGLTGSLKFTSETGRSATVSYQAGELTGIRLEGVGDLRKVFGWEHGTFVVEAHNDLMALAREGLEGNEDDGETSSRRPGRTTDLLFRTEERTVADIIRDREARRPVSRTSPPQSEPSRPSERIKLPITETVEPDPDETIKIVYIELPDRSTSKTAKSNENRGQKVSTGKVVEDRKSDGVEERGSSTMQVMAKEKAEMSDSTSSELEDGDVDVDSTELMSNKSDHEATVLEHETESSQATEQSKIPSFVWVLVVLFLVLIALVFLSVLPELDA